MNRRGLLKGILSAGFAPAFVGSGVLMPLGKVWVPEAPTPEDLWRRAVRSLRNNHAPSAGDFVVFVHPDWRAEIDAPQLAQLSGFRFIESPLITSSK